MHVYNTYIYIYIYRSEGKKNNKKKISPERREKAQVESDVLVHNCLAYSDYAEAPVMAENPFTGDLKKRLSEYSVILQILTIRLEILGSRVIFS